MQALLDHYLKRLSVNRTTLQALFKAADSDGDGLLDRPQARAALTLAQPDLTDTAITTIWLEQEKVKPAHARTHPVLGCLSATLICFGVSFVSK